MSLLDKIMLSIQKIPAGLPSQAPPQGRCGVPQAQPEREPPPGLQPDIAPQLSKAAARRVRRLSEGLPAKSGSGVRKKHTARPQGASHIARAAFKRDQAAMQSEQVLLRQQQAVLLQEQRQVQMDKQKCVAAMKSARSQAAQGDRHLVSTSPAKSQPASTPTSRPTSHTPDPSPLYSSHVIPPTPPTPCAHNQLTIRVCLPQKWAHEQVHGEPGEVLEPAAEFVSKRAQLRDAPGINDKQIAKLECALQVRSLIKKVSAVAVANVVKAARARDAAEQDAYKELQMRTIAIFNRSQVRIKAASRVTAARAVQNVLLKARACDPTWEYLNMSA